jgi:hypothetical protein
MDWSDEQNYALLIITDIISFFGILSILITDINLK